ncbi:MAG: hypothetical protein IPL81_02475 [Flavobacteriales bacterium]|nr:hypothetical protein [Flavobacteriales bacterium]
MGKGFLYLTAVMDWHSCYVLSWHSATPWTPPSVWKLCMVRCCNILHQRSSIPDQGSQYTSDLFTGASIQEGIKVSMDGKAGLRTMRSSNDFGESVKQQCVYRHSPADGK